MKMSPLSAHAFRLGPLGDPAGAPAIYLVIHTSIFIGREQHCGVLLYSNRIIMPLSDCNNYDNFFTVAESPYLVSCENCVQAISCLANHRVNSLAIYRDHSVQTGSPKNQDTMSRFSKSRISFTHLDTINHV
jgi:hypothetical protein